MNTSTPHGELSTLRVIVCGSRHWSDGDRVRDVLRMLPAGSTVVHGAANGADSWAAAAARDLGLGVEAWPAAWSRCGRRAGPMRNAAMVEAGADLVIAFVLVQSGAENKGTNGLVQLAMSAGIAVALYYSDGTFEFSCDAETP